MRLSSGSSPQPLCPSPSYTPTLRRVAAAGGAFPCCAAPSSPPVLAAALSTWRHQRYPNLIYTKSSYPFRLLCSACQPPHTPASTFTTPPSPKPPLSFTVSTLYSPCRISHSGFVSLTAVRPPWTLHYNSFAAMSSVSSHSSFVNLHLCSSSLESSCAFSLVSCLRYSLMTCSWFSEDFSMSFYKSLALRCEGESGLRLRLRPLTADCVAPPAVDEAAYAPPAIPIVEAPE